jgi:N-acetylmuramoyl-L-alanine amidase
MRRQRAAPAGRECGQPHKLTTQGVNRGRRTRAEARTGTSAPETRRHRTEEPGEAGRRCCAYHGPGHEIVKKPFATPEGGEYGRAAKIAGDEDVSLSWKSAGLVRQGAFSAGLRQRTPTERCSYIAGARVARKRRICVVLGRPALNDALTAAPKYRLDFPARPRDETCPERVMISFNLFSRRFFQLAGLAAGAALGGRARAAGTPAPVAAVASPVEAAADHARLIFDLTAPVAAQAHLAANPPRVIVDLPEVAFRIDPREGRATAGSKLIKSYRYGQFAPGRARVVVDLAQPAKIVKAGSEAKAEGAQLVIDLAPTPEAAFAAAAAAAPAEPPAPAVVVPEAAATPVATDKPVVVIDPGHGGVDMGAIGKHGEQEKAIVFDFARALAAKIEAGGRLRAVLTRAEDVFVPLEERVRFAHRQNAALFLSIHADTLAGGHVEGATVYTVANKASDAEAARIAEKENLADKAAGLESKAEVEQVGDILFDLTQRETRAFSAQFSRTLIAHWQEAGSLNKNPARSASFVVLKSYDVPSALLELGYLSSEKDLARLTSPEWRDQAAGKTAEAIEAFFAARSQEARAPQKSARPQ